MKQMEKCLLRQTMKDSNSAKDWRSLTGLYSHLYSNWDSLMLRRSEKVMRSHYLTGLYLPMAILKRLRNWKDSKKRKDFETKKPKMMD